jgi:hypothetical protein
MIQIFKKVNFFIGHCTIYIKMINLGIFKYFIYQSCFTNTSRTINEKI